MVVIASSKRGEDFNKTHNIFPSFSIVCSCLCDCIGSPTSLFIISSSIDSSCSMLLSSIVVLLSFVFSFWVFVYKCFFVPFFYFGGCVCVCFCTTRRAFRLGFLFIRDYRLITCDKKLKKLWLPKLLLCTT